MHRQILVTDPEPALGAERFQAFANPERFPTASPSALSVPHAGKRVEDRVDVRAYAQPHPLQIVADVGDDREPSGSEHPPELRSQPRPTETPGEKDDLHLAPHLTKRTAGSISGRPVRSKARASIRADHLAPHDLPAADSEAHQRRGEIEVDEQLVFLCGTSLNEMNLFVPSRMRNRFCVCGASGVLDLRTFHGREGPWTPG